MIPLTPEQIENNKKTMTAISKFMDDTYTGCMRLGISISINIKNGRTQWRK